MRLRHRHKMTMESLNLTRANHCVVVPQTPDVEGMVHHVKDLVTFGPATAVTVERLLRERGRLVGDRPLTDAHVKEHTDFASIKELAAAIAEGTFRYKDVAEVKPLFRLSPPRKGFKGGVKRSWQAHGALGNRGEAIDELIGRML
jgi:large subunit ribosomal protein L30